MSGAAQGSSSTAKMIEPEQQSSETAPDTSKPAAALEEDDEFEDFPVEGTVYLSLSRLIIYLVFIAQDKLINNRLAARRRRGAGGE